MEATHLSFTIRRSEVQNRILVPKYYDPDLEKSAGLASEEYDLPTLGQILLPGSKGSSLGNWIRRDNYGTGNIPYVRTSDLSHWRIRPDFKKGVSEDVYDRLKKKQDVKPLDILMVAHGTYLVGAVAIVMPGEEQLVLQDHVFRLRVNPDEGISPFLLLAALSTDFVRRQVRARQFSADIIDKIGDRHLTLQIPIPKDPEVRQKVEDRVSKVLEDITTTRDEMAEVSGSDLRMLRQRAESRHAFTVNRNDLRRRILVPKYYDPELAADVEAAKLAADKPWVTLRDLVKKGAVKIGTGVEVGKMAYGTGDIPFVRTSDLLEWGLKANVRQTVSEDIYDRYSPKGSLKAGDILVVRDGTYLVGSSAMVHENDLPALFCGGIYRIRVVDTDTVSPYALLAFLNIPLVRRQMRARQFTRDVIDTLGKRVMEISMPSPVGKDAARLGATVADIMSRKAAATQRMRDTVALIEPPIPARSQGRPGWSMR